MSVKKRLYQKKGKKEGLEGWRETERKEQGRMEWEWEGENKMEMEEIKQKELWDTGSLKNGHK